MTTATRQRPTKPAIPPVQPSEQPTPNGNGAKAPQPVLIVFDDGGMTFSSTITHGDVLRIAQSIERLVMSLPIAQSLPQKPA